MSTIIDADAAKLAGLQIDLLQKMRQGHVTVSHLEWFIGLTRDVRDELVVGGKPASKPTPVATTEKFALLVDLGIITVPDDYDPSTQLARFNQKHQSDEKKSFCYYDDEITDKNFPNPTRVLKPGDKLRVRAFKQVVGGMTISKERMDFLRNQKAVFVGAQGASLVFEDKRDQLPKGKWYASFDEKERLWKDAVCRRGVPNVHCRSDGGFEFGLGNFGRVWDDCHAFLCFTDANQ